MDESFAFWLEHAPELYFTVEDPMRAPPKRGKRDHVLSFALDEADYQEVAAHAEWLALSPGQAARVLLRGALPQAKARRKE